jgi:Ser/Thr protein kinase RdoA (MazF antagonist)
MDSRIVEQLGTCLSDLAARMGSELIRHEPIAPLHSRKGRATFRLWFADGRCVKGRRFRTEKDAALAYRILTRLDKPELPRPLCQSGKAMIEPWIEGRSCGSRDVNEDLLSWAGGVLGAMHRADWRTLVEPAEIPASPKVWIALMTTRLDRLVRADLLAGHEAVQWIGLAESQAPSTVRIGVAHRDLCPENIVLTDEGIPHLIDNAMITVGPIEEDLARVWRRWPMDDSQRRAFLRGYGPSESAERALAQPSLFWAMIVLVLSAGARLQARPGDARELLDRLRRMVAHQAQGAALPPEGSVRP